MDHASRRAIIAIVSEVYIELWTSAGNRAALPLDAGRGDGQPSSELCFVVLIEPLARLVEARVDQTTQATAACSVTL